MNGLSSLDETYSEYLLAPNDDLVRFWRSKVKVTAGRWGSECIHVDAGASKSHILILRAGFSIAKQSPINVNGRLTP